MTPISLRPRNPRYPARDKNQESFFTVGHQSLKQIYWIHLLSALKEVSHGFFCQVQVYVNCIFSFSIQRNIFTTWLLACTFRQSLSKTGFYLLSIIQSGCSCFYFEATVPHQYKDNNILVFMANKFIAKAFFARNQLFTSVWDLLFCVLYTIVLVARSRDGALPR